MNYLFEEEASDFLDLVSANVIKARKNKNYSQLKLAVDMGYSSASYIGRMEIRKDNEHFNLIQLFKIAKILEVPLESLINKQR